MNVCVCLASYSVEREYGGGEQAPGRAESESSQREPSPSGAQPREPRPAPHPAERVPVCIFCTNTPTALQFINLLFIRVAASCCTLFVL